jgi:hypothetical protein
MATVFLSHASQDVGLTNEVVDWLARNGCTDVFVDHTEIRVGDRWTDALRNAKASCRIVLCLVTPRWLQSDECYAEFLAGWYAGKRIMPLLAICGAALDERQQRRVSRLLAEDQGFDLAAVGAPHELAFDAQPSLTATLLAGLKAGGALGKIGLDPFAFEVDVAKRPDPFPGLESFGDEDADAAIFFGRSPEIASCIEDLREMRASGDRRAYTILGASGSGKSSLMKAGVLPRLRRERGWLVLRSFRPGADPLYSFSEAIARTAASLQISWAPGSIHEELLTAWRGARQTNMNEDPLAAAVKSVAERGSTIAFDAALTNAVERRIQPLRERADKATATCLVAIDQTEELVQSQVESGSALADFIAALSAMPASEAAPTVYMFVFTVRDDSFSELRASEKFARVLTRTADIRSLPLYRFAHAIEQPAERYGVLMEPTLVHALIEEAPGTDALPLLAFALRRLWTRFALERRIHRDNYELLGKLQGLIDDAAERALRGMDPGDDSPLTPARVSSAREKDVMRVFIPALVQFNERGHPIRRLAAAETFSEADRELLAPFRRWRLVMTRGSAVEVSHEAMFREWRRFAQWLKPERERLEALRAAEAAAQTWESQGRKSEYLTHRRQRLALAESLWKVPDYKRQMEAVGPLKAYLQACRATELKRSLSLTAVALLLAMTAITLLATNMSTVGSFVAMVANVQAAFPGANFANDQIQEQYAIRRTLLNAVLQRYLTDALQGTTPKPGEPSGTSAEARAGLDAWSVGQIAAALGKGSTLESGKLQAFFDATFIPSCACWSPIDGDQHLAATAWIVLGHVSQGVKVRNEVLNGILGRQGDDGGWPLFFQAARTRQSNSTYATALLLLALHELSSTAYFDTAFAAGIHAAIERARAWLHARAPKDGQYWIDYPDSDGRNVPSRGNSAFVTYVLMTTGDTAQDKQLFREWFAKLGAPTSLDQMDTSDQFINLVDGKVRRDGTRYLTLCWELAAIGKSAPYLDALQRIRARRFFVDALQMWHRDQTGRFDFLTAETLFAINTLFDNGVAFSSAGNPP